MDKHTISHLTEKIGYAKSAINSLIKDQKEINDLSILHYKYKSTESIKDCRAGIKLIHTVPTDTGANITEVTLNPTAINRAFNKNPLLLEMFITHYRSELMSMMQEREQEIARITEQFKN